MSINLINNNDHIFIRGGETQQLIKIKQGLKSKLGRLGHVNFFNLIGQPFDRTYAIDEKTKNFILVSDDMIPDLEAEMEAKETDGVATNLQQDDENNNNNDDDNNDDASAAAAAVATTTRDNRNLVDLNTAQTLTPRFIAEFKEKEGISSLVSKLVQNSTTFASKTAFAQEKYIKRKKTKYNVVFRVERPTVQALCELWNPSMVRRYSGAPDQAKWMRLRIDSIAQILSLGNVNHNSRVMMYERTNAFACAAVLERLSDEGRLFNVMPPRFSPNLLMAEQMGLDQPQGASVTLKEKWRTIKIEDAVFATINQNQSCVRPVGINNLKQKPEECPQELKNVPYSDRVRMELSLDEVQNLISAPITENKKMDCLIIVDDEDPAALTEALLPFLKLSGTICVYSPFMEQITALQMVVTDDAVNIKIQETWLREIQVLPNRTHPHVNMSHGGGYLFSAIKVQPLQEVRTISTTESKKLFRAAQQQQAQDALEKESGARREREE